MAVIGFRCFKNALSYVVLSGDADAPTVDDHAHVSFPVASRPEQLAWVRREVIEILNRTRPTAVGFKGIEGSAQVKDTGRAEVEGVLQEACLSAGVSPLKRLKSQITGRYAPRLHRVEPFRLRPRSLGTRLADAHVGCRP